MEAMRNEGIVTDQLNYSIKLWGTRLRTSFPCGWLSNLDCLECRCKVDPQVRRRELFYRFLLCFHDAGQRGETRFYGSNKEDEEYQRLKGQSSSRVHKNAHHSTCDEDDANRPDIAVPLINHWSARKRV